MDVGKFAVVLLSDIEGQIGRDKLNIQMKNVLTNNGLVYYISCKGEVCDVVIIKYEKHMASD